MVFGAGRAAAGAARIQAVGRQRGVGAAGAGGQPDCGQAGGSDAVAGEVGAIGESGFSIDEC